MHAACDYHGSSPGEANRHHDRLRCCGGTVVHGSVGNLHTGQLTNHGLKFENGLQRALRNFRLVRRVRCKELAARDERVDDDGAIVIVNAGSEEDRVAVTAFVRTLAEPVHDLGFGHLTGNFEIAVETVFGWDGREQIIDRTRADGFEHRLTVGWRFWQIAHKSLY